MIDVHFHGRLVRDPELKTISTGSEVCSFTIACDRYVSKDKREADFLDCEAWEKMGAMINTYFHKGDGIVGAGELRSNSYEDKEGKKRTSWRVTVNKVEFPMAKKSSGAAESAPAETEQTEQFEELPADGNLPF